MITFFLKEHYKRTFQCLLWLMNKTSAYCNQMINTLLVTVSYWPILLLFHWVTSMLCNKCILLTLLINVLLHWSRIICSISGILLEKNPLGSTAWPFFFLKVIEWEHLMASGWNFGLNVSIVVSVFCPFSFTLLVLIALSEWSHHISQLKGN